MVSQDRFSQVIGANDGKLYVLTLAPLDVAMFHGAVRLMLLHPEVREMSDGFHDLAGRLKGFCQVAFADMGFSDEEIEFLDSELV